MIISNTINNTNNKISIKIYLSSNLYLLPKLKDNKLKIVHHHKYLLLNIQVLLLLNNNKDKNKILHYIKLIIIHF